MSVFSIRNIQILFIVFLLNSCSQIEKRGYSFELSNYQTLKELIHNKYDVLNAMGYPTINNDYGSDEIWIYYEEDIKKFLFFKPDILGRQIITISFNKDQTIKNIKNFDLKDQNPIIINANYTKVKSHKVSWWKGIFGNIGQVRTN